MPDSPSDPQPRPPRLTPWEAVKLPSLRNATFALLIAVLGAGLAAGVTLRRDATYQSVGTILLDQADIARVPTPTPIFRVNALRRKYAALIPTEVIAGKAGENLGLPKQVVARTTRAVITGDSLVMYIAAESKNQRGSQALAAAVMDVLIDYSVQEQEAKQVPVEERLTMQIVDHPRLGFKISPTSDDATIAAVFVGGLTAAAAYVLLQLLTAGRRFAAL